MTDAPTIDMNVARFLYEGSQDLLALRTKVFERHRSIARYRLRDVQLYYVFHPELVQEMFGDKDDDFRERGSTVVDFLRPVSGTDVSVLVSNERARWAHDRQTAMMALDERAHFAAYAESITAHTTRQLDRWRARYRDGDAIDIEGQIDQLVVAMVTDSLFTRLGIDAPTIAELIREAASQLVARAHAFNPVPWMLPSRRRRRYDTAIERVRSVTRRLVRERVESGRDIDDMLGNFLHHEQHATGDQRIEDISYQLTVMLAVSFFSTTALLHWSLVALSRNPEVERRIERELAEATAGRAPSFADLPKLRYLHAFLKEVLRMYPSLHGISRQAARDTTLGGYRIPAKANVVVSLYHLHRHPDFWSNPEGFDPQRFVDHPDGQEHPAAYRPFGGGQRACIGHAFATMETALVLAVLIPRFGVELPAHTTVGRWFPVPISMRPDVNTMRLRFKG